MKILMLMPDPGVKGPIAGHGAHLVEAMRQQGAEVVIGRWGRHADKESLPAKATGRLGDICKIRQLLRCGTFDVLFIKTAHDRRALLRDLPLMAATRGLALRRVVQFHGSLSNELSEPGRHALKVASRCLVRSSDAVLLLSSEECREWQAFERQGRYHVVANAYVHNQQLESTGARERDPVDGRAPVILFVGRLITAKGIFDLVDAAARIQQTAACRLVFVGDGADRRLLTEMVHHKRLGDSVAMLGHLSGPDLATAYLAADIFALPSYSEGFPTVLAEAMDAGLPIVTTGIRGAVDRLVEGENALFVPPGRSDLLAEALSRLVLDEGLRRHMAERNREKVREFASDVVAREYMHILSSVLEAPDREHQMSGYRKAEPR